MDIYVFVVQMRWIAVRHRRVAWVAWMEWGIVLFTLTFDSSPIKGEGILAVVLACCTRITLPPCGFPPTRE